MYSSNENNKKNSASQENSDLSETWQALLGQRKPTESDVQHLQQIANDPAKAQHLQQLASDPWSHLLNSQGMQIVDLQKVRLHEVTGNDQDVEHALDIMREAPDGPQNANEKSGDTR